MRAAWLAKDLRADTSWQTELGSADVVELEAAVARAAALGKPLDRLSSADFPLPLLAPRIRDWRHELRRGRGFVLVRGVPVDRWSAWEVQVFAWCFGQHLGIPGAQNAEGELLGHVTDERSSGDARYYLTSRALAFHSDPADVVGLVCVKPARRGGTSQIVSSVSVYNALLRRDPLPAARLYEPLWCDSRGDRTLPAFPVVPCCHAGGELRTFWQGDYFRTAARHPGVPALADVDRELLDAYDAIAGSTDLVLEMDLQPGDVQLLSNHTILHGRTAFDDGDEPGERRHLLRLWLSLPERRSLKDLRLGGRSFDELVRMAAELASG